ncbi:MAG: hypothetical protein AB7S50_11110 [Bacteroidales bacterium]
MLGLYTVIHNKQNEKLSDFTYFIDDEIVKSAYNTKTKSPIQQFKYENWNVLIEGAIYNLNHLEIEGHIIDILKANEPRSKIESFQDIADGEFIIQMINLQQQIGFVISDKYARLPFYYATNSSGIILSRNINTILIDIPEIEFNYQAFYEFVTFEFMLGNKTYFKNIFRLEPFEYLVMSFKKTYQVNLIKRTRESYDKKEQKRPLLEKYYHQLNTSVENRVGFCKKTNLEIASALSGGFDSRAIFGALNKQKVKAKNFTYEYIQDESEIAKLLYKKTGEIGQYEKYSFINKFDLASSQPIVNNYQALANPYTCHVCSNDIKFQVLKLSQNTTLWGGFGGEFIRHPYKYATKDLFTSLLEGYIPGNLFAHDNFINHYSGENFRKELKEHLQSYTEKTLEGQMKHFYMEYYIHRVSNGEDLWGRSNFWTIHPMMALSLIDFFKDMPLKFASFNTFKKLLKKIDPILITVPIYKDKYNLESLFYFKRDIDNYISFLRKQLKSWFRKRLPLLKPVYQKYLKKTTENKFIKIDLILLNEINILFEQSKLINQIFNKSLIIEAVNKKRVNSSSNLISLLFYIKHIEELYSTKILPEK